MTHWSDVMVPFPDLLPRATGVRLYWGQDRDPSHLLFQLPDLLQAGYLLPFQLLLVPLQGLCHLGRGERLGWKPVLISASQL